MESRMSPYSAPTAPRPPLRVALAGIGVVGGGVVRLLETNRELIARRAGRPIEIVAVSARDRHKDRGIDLSAYRWEDYIDRKSGVYGKRESVQGITGGGRLLKTKKKHNI